MLRFRQKPWVHEWVFLRKKNTEKTELGYPMIREILGLEIAPQISREIITPTSLAPPISRPSWNFWRKCPLSYKVIASQSTPYLTLVQVGITLGTNLQKTLLGASFRTRSSFFVRLGRAKWPSCKARTTCMGFLQWKRDLSNLKTRDKDSFGCNPLGKFNLKFKNRFGYKVVPYEI